MRYAQIRSMDISNGPGVRTALFCSGCSFDCPNCFNKEAQNFNYGKEFTEEDLNTILKLSEPHYISGLSLLGGEPAHPKNRDTMAMIAKAFKERFPEKSIWMWSGYQYEQIKDIELLKYVDVLVDGPFIESLKDLRLKFRGSSNQRLILVQESLAANDIVYWSEN